MAVAAERRPVHDGEGEPCPRCLKLAWSGVIRPSMVMPLHPERVYNPLARDGSGPCCDDCASADALVRLYLPEFGMARVVVGNDREDQFRLEGVPMGLVGLGLVKPSAFDDLDLHWRWLRAHGLWPEGDEEDDEKA